MSEEEKKENQSEEEVDQEKLAEEWAKMAEASSSEEENPEESVDQEKLAEEWAKMAESGESSEEGSEVDQEKLAQEWEQMAQATSEEKESQEELAKEWEQMAAQQEKPVEMAEFEKEKLDLLMDIPLEISVEIGSTTMPLEEILKLNPNSIVELDRYIDQPVDIKVNGKLIAKGQLYTVENNFGIKITSIITVQERMKLLSNDEM